MATTEELDVVIKTVADTTGAQQVNQSLQQTQRAAAGVQQQITAGQQGANAVMRGLMAQHVATLENFEKAKQTVSASTGVPPTLLPRDFGIQAAQAAVAARAVGEVTRTVGQQAQVTGGEVLRMSAAFLGAGVGMAAFTRAGQLTHDTVQSLITDTINLDAATRNNTIALGQQAPGFQAWAAQVGQAAGVTQQSLLEAGTAAAQFSRQVGLGPEATTQLTALATVLANIRGQDVGETMTQLTQAMQGNVGAANALGLQLDAATLSYLNFGDATGEVFNLLDPSTQASLRYAAALDQIGKQANTAVGPSQDLKRAQGELNASWEHFTTSTGPVVVDLLAKITGGAAGALEAWNKLVAAQTEQAKAHPEHQLGSELDRLGTFTNELVQPIADRLIEQTAKLRGELGQELSDIGTTAKEANDRLRDTTGFDAQATAANAMAAAVEKTQQALEAAGQAASQIGDTIIAPLQAADRADRAAASAAQDARDEQLRALNARIAEPIAARDAARRNEIEAARALVDLRYQSVQLGAQEAAIRLDMLPAQQRLLELQNQTNRAQIEATQRALPAQRGLQDLQTQIEQQQLIAQSGFRSMAERQAALRTGAALVQQLPEARLAASQAGAAALPAQRAAQDVQAQAQLFALQQQAALFGPEFLRQQLTLLSQIADAAKQAAQRTLDVTVQGMNLVMSGFGTLTADDEKRLVDLVGQVLAAQIHEAVVAVNNSRTAPSQLLGAT